MGTGMGVETRRQIQDGSGDRNGGGDPWIITGWNLGQERGQSGNGDGDGGGDPYTNTGWKRGRE